MKKNINIYITVIICFVFFIACKQSPVEGFNPPSLSFKTTAGYVHKDTTMSTGSDVLIGIIAERGNDEPLKDADDLSNFIIKLSTNGGPDAVIYEYTMTSAEAALYEYDFTGSASAIVGDSVRYNVVVYNKDGYIAQKDVTIISN